MTVLSFERFAVDPRHTDRFDELIGGLVSQMRAAPGCLWADVARAIDDGGNVLLVAEWRNEGDADAWDVAADRAAFADACDPFLTGDITRRRFRGSP